MADSASLIVMIAVDIVAALLVVLVFVALAVSFSDRRTASVALRYRRWRKIIRSKRPRRPRLKDPPE